MTEEKKAMNRRSFLKRAAGVAAGAAAATGGMMALFPSSAKAVRMAPTRAAVRLKPDQARYKLVPKAHQLLDPEQKQDDLGDLVNVYRAAFDESMTKADKVVEQLIRDENFRGSFDKNSTAAVRSQAAIATPISLDGLKVPAAILEKARAAKAEGWHSHYRVSVWGWSWHHHLTW
jgi:hypothetical protein